MAQFPSSHSYGQSCGNDAAFVIINGRRVPVGAGLSGRDLETMAGGAGRRTTVISNGHTRILDANRFYTSNDLKDRQGRPVKISSIPDRTKGGIAAVGERVLVFLDFANVNAGAPPLCPLDYGQLLDYLAEGRFLVEAYAYVPIDPRNPEARRDLVRHLQENGWMVHQKMGKIAGASYKSNVDVEMCIDMMRSAQQIRPDIMVLCSGDGDFLPVVRELRRMGIRTEVASFERAADASLPYEASGFISLDVWQREALSAGNDMSTGHHPNGMDENGEALATESENDSAPQDFNPDTPCDWMLEDAPNSLQQDRTHPLNPSSLPPLP